MSIFDNVFEQDTKKNKAKKSSTAQNTSKKLGDKLQEFKEEFSEGISEYDDQLFRDSGLVLSKVSENTASIKYEGLLARSGADDVYTMVGYGDNNNWQDIQTIRMNRFGNSFHADIPINSGLNTNLVFKDSAENWDNNNGMNYTFY
ncbi:MAG TPA: carbohydrate-binding protein [Thermoclostridium sp.]|nr:carbohydrate-binding protein [Thermoclostridium sp.]